MTAQRNSLAWVLAASIAFANQVKSGERLQARSGDAAFSTRSSLILVPVTVLDRNGANVLDLRQDHFKVFDNSEQRPIVSFAREEAPLMLGVVLDVSGSMWPKASNALAAIHAIVRTTERLDQGFLITFADRPELRVDLTSNLDELANAARLPTARGGTALIDGVYEALQKSRSTRHSRRALLVTSDGGDNSSRYRESQLVALAKEADTQIYSISIQEHAANKEERRGYYILDDLSKLTGGLHFMVRGRGELPKIAEKIAVAMKSVYVIGYKPPQNLTSAKWRRIRVVLESPQKTWRAYAKTGYYALE